MAYSSRHNGGFAGGSEGIPRGISGRISGGISGRSARAPLNVKAVSSKALDLKKSHLNTFRARHDRSTETRRERHCFHVAALMPDGQISEFEHMAERDLFLEDICANFARGTLIATPSGETAIEDLRPGDTIRTRDNGDQVLRWIGSCTFPPLARERPEQPRRAIRIKADALGEMRPMQDLLVSSRFRLLSNHPSCAALFGSSETLAPALDILDEEAIFGLSPAPDLEFFNVMLDSHQIIRANGLETESYHPGTFGVSVMSFEMRSHLRRLFAHLDGDLDSFGATARPILKGFEAEVLRVG